MKIVVTGATGFVGGALLNRLLAAGGFDVLAAVRQNDNAILKNMRYVTVGEIGADTAFEQFLKGYETVVHLAARAHVMRDKTADPLQEFRRVNVAGTLNLARQAAAAGVRRIVFVSSIKVNGETTLPGKPFTEKDPPAPVDPYAISKYEAEVGLRAIASATDMEVVIIRPPLVYGPGVKGNFLSLLDWIRRGIPLPIANGDNRRSLLNVHNLVDFIVQCVEHPAAAGETFLVSDGEDISVADLARQLAHAMGKRPRLFPVPLTLIHAMLRVAGQNDLWQRLFGSLQLSHNKARDLIGWSAPRRVEEGLEEVGRWYAHTNRD